MMNESEKNVSMNNIAWKLSKHGVFSGPCFPVFGLNTETYVLNLGIQSKCRKIRTRKNAIFKGQSSRKIPVFHLQFLERKSYSKSCISGD